MGTIVVNKMMGSKTDDQLTLELMTEEPDYIPGYQQRNAIRHKLTQCFEDIRVYGLPVLSIPPNKELTYNVLTSRFRDGLAKVASMILDSTPTPRTISIGSLSLVMNSTNAERIIATVIDEANKGKIDLTGFDAMWTSIAAQVSITLGKVRQDLVVSSNNCEKEGKTCSPCVCAYRNKVIKETLNSVNKIIENGKIQAKSQFKIDATPNAKKLVDNIVSPWEQDLACTSESKHQFDPLQTGICDTSIVSFTSGMKCGLAYICQVRDVPYSAPSITLNTDGIYLHDGAAFNLLLPPKAGLGKNGALPGENGSNGAVGIKGTSLTINANHLLEHSITSMTIVARGGEGGNGGDGKAGANGAPGVKGADGSKGTNGQTGANGADDLSIPTNRDPINAAAVKTIALSGHCDQMTCNHIGTGITCQGKSIFRICTESNTYIVAY